MTRVEDARDNRKINIFRSGTVCVCDKKISSIMFFCFELISLVRNTIEALKQLISSQIRKTCSWPHFPKPCSLCTRGHGSLTHAHRASLMPNCSRHDNHASGPGGEHGEGAPGELHNISCCLFNDYPITFIGTPLLPRPGINHVIILSRPVHVCVHCSGLIIHTCINVCAFTATHVHQHPPLNPYLCRDTFILVFIPVYTTDMYTCMDVFNGSQRFIYVHFCRYHVVQAEIKRRTSQRECGEFGWSRGTSYKIMQV